MPKVKSPERLAARMANLSRMSARTELEPMYREFVNGRGEVIKRELLGYVQVPVTVRRGFISSAFPTLAASISHVKMAEGADPELVRMIITASDRIHLPRRHA